MRLHGPCLSCLQIIHGTEYPGVTDGHAGLFFASEKMPLVRLLWLLQPSPFREALKKSQEKPE